MLIKKSPNPSVFVLNEFHDKFKVIVVLSVAINHLMVQQIRHVNIKGTFSLQE